MVCCWPGDLSVCRPLCALFSPKNVWVGAVRGLSSLIFSLDGLIPARVHRLVFVSLA